MKKMTRTNPDEARHMNNLIYAMLYTCAIPSITSMNVARHVEVNFGIVIDWHDVAASLDELATKEKITRTGTNANGNATYETK